MDDEVSTGSAYADMLRAMKEVGLPSTLAPSVAKEEMLAFRVPREVVELGIRGGAAAARTLECLPDEARGTVLMSFDGWDDDPRDLHQIPAVVDFCRGVLFGDTYDESFATRVVPMLADESALYYEGNEDAFGLCGRLFVVSIAFAEQVFVDDPVRRTWVRNLEESARLLRGLVGRGDDGDSSGMDIATLTVTRGDEDLVVEVDLWTNPPTVSAFDEEGAFVTLRPHELERVIAAARRGGR